MKSNRPFSKWAELMSDEAVATAMLDRLLHKECGATGIPYL